MDRTDNAVWVCLNRPRVDELRSSPCPGLGRSERAIAHVSPSERSEPPHAMGTRVPIRRRPQPALLVHHGLVREPSVVIVPVELDFCELVAACPTWAAAQAIDVERSEHVAYTRMSVQFRKTTLQEMRETDCVTPPMVLRPQCRIGIRPPCVHRHPAFCCTNIRNVPIEPALPFDAVVRSTLPSVTVFERDVSITDQFDAAISVTIDDALLGRLELALDPTLEVVELRTVLCVRFATSTGDSFRKWLRSECANSELGMHISIDPHLVDEQTMREDDEAYEAYEDDEDDEGFERCEECEQGEPRRAHVTASV
jgi:hypothetical protein